MSGTNDSTTIQEWYAHPTDGQGVYVMYHKTGKFSWCPSGKKNIINKFTGIRQQILSSEFSDTIHINLGDKRQYFKCRDILTTKEKNVSIYEWHRVSHIYEIIDTDVFDKATEFKEGINARQKI